MGALEQALAKEAAKRGLQGVKPPPGGLGGLGKLGLAGVAVGIGVAGLGLAIQRGIKEGQEPLKRLDQPEGGNSQEYESGDATSVSNFGLTGKTYNVSYSAYSRGGSAKTFINAGGLNYVPGPVSVNLYVARYSNFDTWFGEIRGSGQGLTGSGSNTFYYNDSHRLGNIRITPTDGQGDSWKGQQISGGSSGRSTLAPGVLPDFKPGTDKNQDRNQEEKAKKLIPGGAPNGDKQRNKDNDRQKDKNKFPGGEGSKAPELQLPPPVLAPPPASPDITLTPGKGRSGGGSSKVPTAKAPPPPQTLPDLKGGDSSKIIDNKRLPTPDAIEDRQKEPNQTPIDPCIVSSPCGTTQIRNTETNLRNALDDLYKGIDLSLLYTINTKLGDQIPGGIGPFLKGFQEASKRFADWSKLDRAINLLNLWINLHNAFMLSRNLADTLFSLTDQFFSVFGVELKDDEGQSIGISNAIGNALESTAQRLVGVENWTNITETVAKANRIYQSASQIVWTVRSIQDSAREIAEWTAENTGKIGNALKKWRIVGEDAYKWMPEKIESQNAWMLKINRFRDQTEALEDAASSLSSVIGEVQSIQSEFDELKEQKDKFNENLEQFEPKERPDNVPVKDDVTESKTVSAAPTNIDVVFRGEGEESNAGT